MAVTFSLPTVLAKLADGQSSIQASGSTLGDVVVPDRRSLSPAGAATARRQRAGRIRSSRFI